MLKITTPNTAPRVPFQLDGRIMLARHEIEIIQLTLKPGEVVPKHVNDFDVAVYIIEGQGIMETGSEKHDVEPGMLAEVLAGEERGLKNTGNKDFKVLVMKIFR
jgi:quercetin dioxygenase-like cupin family protein